MFKLDTISGELVGNIHIAICKTNEGNNFFKIDADNDNVLPVLDVIEDTLVMY